MLLTARNLNHKEKVFVTTNYQRKDSKLLYVTSVLLPFPQYLNDVPLRIVWPKNETRRFVLLASCAALVNFFLQCSENTMVVRHDRVQY